MQHQRPPVFNPRRVEGWSFLCYSLACFEAAETKGEWLMFEVDHANLPKGENYRELRQFVNSMELRSMAERLGCSSITIITCRYRDYQSGQQQEGYFIASTKAPNNPLLLIREKRGHKGADLFKYSAELPYSERGWWSDAVPVRDLVH